MTVTAVDIRQGIYMYTYFVADFEDEDFLDFEVHSEDVPVEHNEVITYRP